MHVSSFVSIHGNGSRTFTLSALSTTARSCLTFLGSSSPPLHTCFLRSPHLDHLDLLPPSRYPTVRCWFLGQSDANGKSGIETHFALMKSESESPSSPSPSPSPCPGPKLETCPHVFHVEVPADGRRFCLLLLLHLLHHPQAWARIKRVSQHPRISPTYTKTI